MDNLHPTSGAIPFVDLRAMISDTEPMWRPALEALLERAQFVLGRELTDFEAEFAASMRAGFAVGVANGTSALELRCEHAQCALQRKCQDSGLG